MAKEKSLSFGAILHRFLLRLPAETAHDLGLGFLRLGQALPGAVNYLGSFSVRDQRLEQRLLDRAFPNPVGLAAGFDKNGVAMAAMAALGFGFIEVGTVTRRSQTGNPRPRLFRHREEASLENAMGFNNSGAAALRRRLQRHHSRTVPLGVNLGKNKTTPNEQAVEEYADLVRSFEGCCDYFVVNVSSPNTPGLRDLQTAEMVSRILAAARTETRLPVLLKLAPDLETSRVVELAKHAVAVGAAGIILTNTTIDYRLLPAAHRVGGLSGRVLKARSFELLQAVADELFGRCLLVSVGGVDSGREVYRRLRAGANVVQLYSALAFDGPALVGSILRELLDCLDRDGLASVGEAVGADL